MKRILRISMLCFVFCLHVLLGYSQLHEHPFSRQDSAMLKKYQENFDEQVADDNPKEASRFLNMIAMIHWEHNRYEAAIGYYERSLEINEKLGNENGVAMLHNNLAMIHSDLKHYDKSKEYFYQTLAARRASNESIGIISAAINLSVVLNNLEEYDESVKFLEEALELARQRNDADQMKSCYGMLSETCEKAGFHDKSLKYFNLYRTFHEMVQKEKIAKSRHELENEKLKAQLLETQKRNKELEIKAKEEIIKEKDAEIAIKDSTAMYTLQALSRRSLELKVLQQGNRLKEAEDMQTKMKMEVERKERQRWMFSLLVGIGALVIVSVVLLVSNNHRRKANTLLAKQNKEILQQQVQITEQRDHINDALEELKVKNFEITSSINYARLIQQSMLDRQRKLHELLPQSFIMYLPRDIVSGDFYWYHENDGKILIAAVDCTGHGVPGAFMSMLGYNLLNQIVISEGETSPKRILERLDQGVVNALNQCYTKNQDGMDLAICVIDQERKKLTYGGAKNPLLLVQDGELVHIKGSRRSVGGCVERIMTRIPFVEHEISLKKNNQFYIFSDGILDQFGGDKHRKFNIAQLRDTVKDLAYKEPLEQHEWLLQIFDNWRGKNSQIDDVLLIGANVTC